MHNRLNLHSYCHSFIHLNFKCYQWRGSLSSSIWNHWQNSHWLQWRRVESSRGFWVQNFIQSIELWDLFALSASITIFVEKWVEFSLVLRSSFIAPFDRLMNFYWLNEADLIPEPWRCGKYACFYSYLSCFNFGWGCFLHPVCVGMWISGWTC